MFESLNNYWQVHKNQWHAISLTPLFMTLFFIIFASVFISNSNIEPVYDQLTAISGQLSLEDYPTFSQGVSTKIVFGLYNFIDDWDPITSNSHIRILIMATYMIAGLLLFSTQKPIREKVMLTIIMQILLFTSLYAFLWASHEVLAGTFLMLVFWSYFSDKPFALTASFLALFSLAKPDLAFSGGLMGIYLAYESGQTWRQRIMKLGIYIGIMIILCLPGIIHQGAVFFEMGRSSFSFFQHYAALIEPHQITPSPNPWLHWEVYRDGVLGEGTDSLVSIIARHPRKYYDFLLLSAGQTMVNLVRGKILYLLPLLFIALYQLIKNKYYGDPKTRNVIIMVIIVSLGLVPITLMSFTHVRYMARFYPIVLFVIYTYLLKVKSHKIYWVGIGYLFLIVILQLPDLKTILWSVGGNWGPD
ncbi:hypothetical protein ACFLYO_09395 [Chloroflexota bacterium]